MDLYKDLLITPFIYFYLENDIFYNLKCLLPDWASNHNRSTNNLKGKPTNKQTAATNNLNIPKHNKGNGI